MMSDTVRYNPDRDWFELDFSGRLDAADIIARLEHMISHPAWGRGKPRLSRLAYDIDLSAITLDAIQNELGPWMADHAQAMGENQSVAVVANDDIQRVLAEFFSLAPAIRDRIRVEVFSNEAAAIAFLEKEKAAAAR